MEETGEPGPQALFLAPSGVASDIERTVAAAVREAGGHPIRPQDEVPPGVEWESAASILIMGADLVVADITSGDPNVMYELGFAHAMRKATVLLMDEGRACPVPRAVARHLIVIYGGSEGVGRVAASVRREVGRLARRRHSTS